MNNIAGIDLGTTFSAIAALNSIGKPEIIPNTEGERITPSAIFFDDEDSQIIRVGIEAINSRQLNPQRSVRWIKRHMGDASWKLSIDGKDWAPEEISSLILKKLKQDSEKERGSVTDAVISVPAHFDEVRRKATMDAGTMAGLNVIAIVNEPVAAALYYATTHDITGRVLVYDLGGGTFDVTILDIEGSEINIVCSQGDHALGGIDFDRKILEIFESAYKEKFDTDLITSDEDRAKFEDEAEDTKKTLSRRPVAKKMLYGSAGNMRMEISRQQFEQAIAPLIARTEMLIEVTLEEAKCKPADITKVLLVGGSTRIPAVQQRLTDKFGFAPDIAVNVDECVALGAAIHAGLTIMREKPDQIDQGIAAGLKDVKLKDVCNHSYGTICAPKDAQTGRYSIENSVILRKNTPLPCSETQQFYTIVPGQSEIEISITQGEDKDPDYVNKIATEVFELPENHAQNRPITVTYSYDLNQRMHCTFTDEDSGKTMAVDFALGENGLMTLDNVQQKTRQLEGFTVE